MLQNIYFVETVVVIALAIGKSNAGRVAEHERQLFQDYHIFDNDKSHPKPVHA
jgi:hypothetical protein